MPRVAVLLLALTTLASAAHGAPPHTEAAAGRARYDGHRVYRVQPASSRHVAILQEIQRRYPQLDFWTQPVAISRPVDVMVPPDLQEQITETFNGYAISYSIFIGDVQRLIDNESPHRQRAAGFDWTDYYPLENVYSWLESLVEQYPGVVSSVVIGSTFEGREQRGVKISFGDGKPVVFLESGAHAREWITVATATYIVNELLTSTNASFRALVESFDWYVVPSTNPDGYEYTHTSNRMWRKTRSQSDDQLCVGTDPNRNWDYYWMDEGASSISCSETYAGPSVFSEVETRTLSEFLQSISDDLLVYLSLHSYSQLLMIPYGLNYERPDNYDELMEIGGKAVDALKQRYGTQYQYGTIYDIIYPAAGGSIDWVKKALGTRFVFEWELRDEGQYGFLLPADQIVPTALETIDSMVAILQEVVARTASR
ncbi:zinc carboxypeptidase-like [Schistocerca nitens]|uniref:zinc carboxypeptidase-like n=1 Tax=Schistocerca nitens TaxID=7011 RepID=UPI0021180F78|nr:zinc carboxypeptidase-like [Schistocerca nitens]